MGSLDSRRRMPDTATLTGYEKYELLGVLGSLLSAWGRGDEGEV